MPFISDDYDHHLVDDEEYVDEDYEDYVIVRKLYVRLHESFLDDNYLHRRFKKYGKIESTEVLESGKDGFVTFTCDRQACLAYETEKRKCAQRIELNCCVEIAYTWHQPRKAQTNNKDRLHPQYQSVGTPSLLQLNDDCLFAVFDRCDNQTLARLSDTCTRFNTLLTSAYKFPKNKEFEIYGYADNCGSLMSLAEVRKIVRLMGPYFQTLDLSFDLEPEATVRYFQMVMKYCKSNTLIRELKLVTYTWQKEFDTLIKPILKNLQTLELRVLTEDEVFLPDITVLCPNLKKLVIDVFVEEFSAMTITNLESFSFESRSNYLTQMPNALEFFVFNPQIAVFKCSDLLSKDLRNIAICLLNVRKLSLCVDKLSSSNDFQHLKEFKHLRKLKLRFVPLLFKDIPKINLTETIECFRGLNNLTELKLYFKQENKLPPHEIQQSVIAVSKMLPNLERFDLVGFKLLESTVVNFNQYAGKLKSLHLHICDVYATESLITKLVTLRKSRRQDKLKLLLDDDSRNNVAAVNASDIQEYLSVCWNCRHNLRFVEKRKWSST